MKKAGIYLIKRIKNEKCYIGQSSDMHTRLRHHRSLLRGQKHPNFELQSDFKVYGESAFEFLELFDCSNLDFSECKKGYGHFADNPMNEIESRFIKKYNSYYGGYNHSIQIVFNEKEGVSLLKAYDDCFEKTNEGFYKVIEGAECDYSLNHCKGRYSVKCKKCGFVIKEPEYNYCPICGEKI